MEPFIFDWMSSLMIGAVVIQLLVAHYYNHFFYFLYHASDNTLNPISVKQMVETFLRFLIMMILFRYSLNLSFIVCSSGTHSVTTDIK